MSHSIRVLSTLCVFGALLAGCHAPPSPTAATELRVQIPDYEQFVDRTLTLLRERDFEPDRVDRPAGVIVAGPTTSAQWFEFWRSDVQGAYQVLEASLHTIQRRVSITLTPAEAEGWAEEAVGPAVVLGDAEAADGAGDPDVTAVPGVAMAASGGRYRLVVQVDKYRYSAPERQVTTASGALSIYSERLPTTEGLRGARSRGLHWVPLGRDGLLEGYLLAKILSANPDVKVVP